MKRHDSHVFPLSPAHLTWIAAIQLSFFIALFDTFLATIPLFIFLLACFTAPFLSRLSFYLPITSHGKTKSHAVSLTFDDGPHPCITPQILQLLDKHSVHATFFVTGKQADTYPELIRLILKHGHDIGNHSYSHNPMLMLKSKKKLFDEIKSTQSALSKFKIYPLAFRPPVGITNPRLWPILLNLGMFCITYNRRACDMGNRRVAGIASRILKHVRNNDIILLHDKKPKREEDASQLLFEIETLIIGIQEKRLNIIPLHELIRRPIMNYNCTNKDLNPTRIFYNSLSDDYDNEQENSIIGSIRKQEFDVVIPQIDKIINSDIDVLEIGSGTGRYTLPIAMRCNSITAVDISEKMLSILSEKAEKSNIKNINIITGNIENISIDKKYSVLCSFSSFEYINDLAALISHLSDNLHQGGYIYFTTAHLSFFRFFAQIGNALRQGIWLKAYSRKEIQKILKNCNFENVSISTHTMKTFLSRGILLEVSGKKK